MSERMRPMRLGEILDRTVQIYRSRFLMFAFLASFPPFVMAALVAANVLVWQMLPDAYGPRALLWLSTPNLFYLVVVGNVSTLLYLAIWPAFVGATAKASSGERFGVVTELGICFARWKSWIGLALANWFSELILPELLVGGVLVGTALLMFEVIKMDPNDPYGLGPKMFGASVVVGWVVFQWASACFSLSVPVWTLEGGKVLPVLKRSWKLSKGTRWRIGFTRVAATVLCQVLGGALTVVPTFLLLVILRHSMYWWSLPVTALQMVRLLGVVISAVAATLVGLVFPIALTLFYYDQRMRHEGYDIERLMDAAGLSATEAGTGVEVAAASAQPEGAPS